jgi:hypothetical protein
MIHGNHLVLFWTYLNHEPLLWLTLTVVFYVIAHYA